MAPFHLIFCGGSNKTFAEIATSKGFMYGSQLPRTIYKPLFFADQDWKNPNREAYMKAVKKHNPYMATVIDWEFEYQRDEVMDWAHEIVTGKQIKAYK